MLLTQINTNIDLQNWDTQFSLGPIFAMLQMDVLDYNKDGMQDSVERVRAVKEGIYNPLKNTYAMDIWKQVKRKYDTKNSPILQEGYETTDYEPLWQEGKVAIWEDGMWKLPYVISDTSLDFEFGMFPPPVIYQRHPFLSAGSRGLQKKGRTNREYRRPLLS